MEQPTVPSEAELPSSHAAPPQDLSASTVYDDGLEIIHRKGWGAARAVNVKELTTVSYLMYGHTKTYADRLRRNVHCYECMDTDSNREKVKAIQDLDSKYFGDIRYSFLIGGDGKVYEGRGWTYRPGLPKHYQIYEDKSLLIAMIEPLPDKGGVEAMVRARNSLIKHGVAQGHISPKCTEVTMNNKYFWPQFRKFLSRL